MRPEIILKDTSASLQSCISIQIYVYVLESIGK